MRFILFFIFFLHFCALIKNNVIIAKRLLRKYFVGNYFNQNEPDITINQILSSSSFNFCGSDFIFGPTELIYTVLEMHYSGIMAHTKVILNFDLFIFDEWNNDQLIIKLIGNHITIRDLYFSTSFAFGNICGDSGRDDIFINYEVSIEDEGDNFVLSIENSLINPKSFGIKNIRVFLAGDIIDICPSPCLTCDNSGNCLTCPTFAQINSNTCVCVDGFYIDEIDYPKCMPCFYQCHSCNGPNSDNCLTCFSGYTLSSSNDCEHTADVEVLYEFIENFDHVNFDSWTTKPDPSLLVDDGTYWPMRLAGGFNKFGQNAILIKEFHSDPHFQTFISLNVFTMDNFNAEFYIKINGHMQFSERYPDFSLWSGDGCGDFTYNENYKNIFFEITDTLLRYSTVLEIEFGTTLTLDSNFGSWGMNNLKLIFILCDYTCLECLDALTCKSCPSDRYFIDNRCDSFCPIGFYADTTANLCISCASLLNCEACSSGTVCTQCKTHFYLNSGNCLPCDSNCNTCSGSSLNCLSCYPNTYLYSFGCVHPCPGGMYHDTQSWTCNLCPILPHCSLCDTAILCHICDLPYYNQEGICVSSCSSNFFISGLNCLPCDLSCNGCITASNNCTSCYSGFSLNQNNNCLEICSIGSFYNTPINTCDYCNPECYECEHNAHRCTSCISGLFLDINSCVTTCPSNKWGNSLINKCNKCIDSIEHCLECSNGENCLQCESDYTLSHGKCIKKCGQYTYLSDNICKNCGVNCFQCIDDKNCEICATSFYLFEKTCVEDCLETYYANKIDSKCYKCDISCLACSGPSNTQCTKCSLTKNLKNGVCQGCNIGFYLDENKECKECINNCKNCVNNYSCSICETNFYLLQINNSIICSDCLSNNIYQKNQYCYYCIENCKICSSSENCSQCYETFYYKENEKSCVKKTIIDAIFEKTLNSTLFKLKFNDTYIDLFSKLEINNQSYFKFNINSINSNYYFYEIKKTNNLEFTLNLSTYQNIVEKTEAEFHIYLNELENISNKFYLTKNNFKIQLEEIVICPNSSFFDIDKKLCANSFIINPILLYTNNPTIIELSFKSGHFPELKTHITNFSLISIDNLNFLNYSFEIKPSSDNEFNYFINLFFNDSIIGRPNLHYKIYIDKNLIDFYNLKIETNYRKIKLFDSYKLQESELQAINNSASASKTGDALSQGSGAMSSVFGAATSVFVRSLMLIELIYLLKFININYPPNTVEIFTSKSVAPKLLLKNNLFLDDYQFSEEIPDLFKFYSVNSYFLDNVGEIILQIIVIYFLALFIIILNNYFEHTKSKILAKILMVLKSIFQWPIVLFLFLNNLQKLFFYISCSLFFSSRETKISILNFFCSLLTLPIIILIILHLIKVINNINNESISVISHFSSKNIPFSQVDDKLKFSLETSKRLDNTNFQSEINSESNIGSILDSKLPSRFKFNKKTSLVFPDSRLSVFSGKNKNDKNNLDEKENEINTNISLKSNKIFKIDNENNDSDQNTNKSIFSEKKVSKNSKYFQIIPIKLKNSNFISRFCNVLNISTIYHILYKIKDLDQYKKKYGLLHSDFKKRNFFSKYFILLDFLRQIFLSIIVVFLFQYPGVNIIFIFSFQILFLFLIAIYNPFQNYILYIFTIFFEIITDLAIGASLGLFIMDYTENKDISNRMKMGWIIIASNLILLYSFVLCAFILVLNEKLPQNFLRNIWNKIKCVKKNKIYPSG